jgi:Tol biopolymer transport system component
MISKGLVFGALAMLFVATMVSVSLSPDFKKVAYLDLLNDDDSIIEQLWVINTDESDLKKLDEWEITFGNISIVLEEWNPDGDKILYTVHNWKGDKKDLWIINSDGTGKKRIAEYVQQGSHVSLWSPDGSKIAFESEYSREGICVVNSDGGNKTLITRDGSLRYWTPDGKKIIFLKYPKFWEIDLDSAF